MQQALKYVLAAAVVTLVAVSVAGTAAVIPASAQSSSGPFNPQARFALGTKLQITSVYGLESILPPFSNGGFNHGNHMWSHNGNYTQTSRAGNQGWNLTYLRDAPTADSSILINVQVTNGTQDGGILWVVQGGTIAYNGTTLTVTGGNGGIGGLDRVVTIGNATDSNGDAFRWSLEGLTTLYGGSILASLTGSVDELNQNTTLSAPTSSISDAQLIRGVSLTYIATVS